MQTYFPSMLAYIVDLVYSEQPVALGMAALSNEKVDRWLRVLLCPLCFTLQL